MWHTMVALQDFSRSIGDLKSALTILNIPQKNLDQDNGQNLVITNSKIKFKDIDFCYTPEKPIFQELTLTI